jgi:hypothetical protein
MLWHVMKLTGSGAFPIMRSSFDPYHHCDEWKERYVFYISATVQLKKEA